MRAMILDAPHAVLRLDKATRMPQPGAGEVLIQVHACGVCRTDLHILDGERACPKLPLVPGHEIVSVPWPRPALESSALAWARRGTVARPIRTTTTQFSLIDANQALAALRAGRVEGAAVLVP